MSGFGIPLTQAGGGGMGNVCGSIGIGWTRRRGVMACVAQKTQFYLNYMLISGFEGLIVIILRPAPPLSVSPR